MKHSLNNRLILEKYEKEALRKDTSKSAGFAMIAQKTALKGLRVLVASTISNGNAEGISIPAGAVAYIKEDILHTAPWAQKFWECDAVSGQFMIVDSVHVEFFKNE